MPKSAEEIIAETLADGRTAGRDGIPRVGRGTRKKAQAIISALESAGYVIMAARPPAASPGVRDVERAYAASRPQEPS